MLIDTRDLESHGARAGQISILAAIRFARIMTPGGRWSSMEKLDQSALMNPSSWSFSPLTNWYSRGGH